MVKIYIFCYNALQVLTGLCRIFFAGFWLGVLKKEALHLIDKFYYDYNKMYLDREYNKSGLRNWEKRALERYFQRSKKILVIGAGGGREVLALLRLGYEVYGVECHPQLVKLANELLKEEGFTPNVRLISRDQCPKSDKVYDGIIIGWGAYMLIQGKKQRITFLKDLNARARGRSPILLSFFYRPDATRKKLYFGSIAVIANIIRRCLGRRDWVEVGDDLALTGHVHYFTREEIISELHKGGFELVFFSQYNYGHAVGLQLNQEDIKR